MDKIIILGNGISGVSTARHIRKRSDNPITIVSNETDHFFSRTALMYIYMGHMEYRHTKPYEDWFWEKNDIKLKRGWVKNIDFGRKALVFDNDEEMPYDKLVLAVGSEPNKFGWPGQDLKGVSGLYSYQDLEYMEEYSKGTTRAVIIGGGLIGIEMAEMFQSRGIKVAMLVRESSFWNNVLPYEESELINRHIREHHIDLRLSTELQEILPDTDGRVKEIITKDGEHIECQFVGLTAGVHPKIDFLKDTGLETQKGILVNEYLETNIPDVYACGDCVQHKNPPAGRRPVEQVWYTGRIRGETLALTLTGKKTAYQPDLWFNSAKFLDIEYQTYGTVGSKLNQNEDKFYWEHQDGKKCIKIVFDKDSRVVKGVNLFGIRMRHEVWNNWLNEKKELAYIIENLKKAYFDPEFFTLYDDLIQEKYNQQFPDKPISIRKKTILERIFS